MLKLAYQLSVGLVEKRFSKRKAALVDIADGIYLDQYGNVRQLKYSSGNAHLLIYSLMILSNEMVSQYFVENNLPGIFRNHAPKNKNEVNEIIQKIIKNNEKIEPPLTKVQRLLKGFQSFFKKLFRIKNDVNKSKKDEAKNGTSPDPKWLLRLSKSFLRAKYEVKNKGHQSLLIDSYLHFTSPIRRLADMINHMVLHARLNSQPIPFTRKKLRKLAKSLNK
jgi:ribonuclease R